MRVSRPALAIAALVVASVSLLLSMAALAVGVLRISAWLEGVSDPQTISEALATALTESGFEPARLDPGDPLLASRVIVLGEEVNERSAREVVSKLLYLDRLDPRAPIDLYIATSGGWTDSAFAIIDTMERISAPVNTWAVGGCYSAGTLILAAGTGRRRALPYAIMMVHANMREAEGQHDFDRLDLARYEKVFRSRTRIPSEWYPLTSDEEYCFDAEGALGYGVVDEIATTAEKPGTSPISVPTSGAPRTRPAR